MSDAEINALKQETRSMFYHGFDNYLTHAYPEDELRPISCEPMTRDTNDAHHERNDALGNYSLSMIDSLSTLAILASSATSSHDNHDALQDLQTSISRLVEDYGDGTDGSTGTGRRARGFDLNSKVQVFETTIRGVGGLLSAHLFIIGHLPIEHYAPTKIWQDHHGRDFGYDGQLLRLALDLATRLLPAFDTPFGIPYPRVNLRHGTAIYSQPHTTVDPAQCAAAEVPIPYRETTETCAAGAGSLVLEFTTLSRLSGDPRFEQAAHRAFFAIWHRKSELDLVGSGVDSVTGQWVSPITGIGAGVDSFYEYAFKSHVLLAGKTEGTISMDYLHVWQDSHTAISRHLRSSFHHAHYAQSDKDNGGLRMTWIDSLSAYYPGLLTLAGHVEEAASAHLLYTALWSRYGALPERWNTVTGQVEGGLTWWAGRPEFIESTWYLYRATRDPWYLRVGEMVLKDIKQRCRAQCGWAGLQNVDTGEQNDRMESFFLGETVKYLYLLFDRDHPLNKLDDNFVFSTEGHPLILPCPAKVPPEDAILDLSTCPVPSSLPFGMSITASRTDLFHAAHLAKLSLDTKQVNSTQSLFYPWTLPLSAIPPNGTCKKLSEVKQVTLSFPLPTDNPLPFMSLQRVQGGVLANTLKGLRFTMTLDTEGVGWPVYRISSLSSLALGRDESIWLAADVVNNMEPMDPRLSKIKDLDRVDLIVDALESETSLDPIPKDEIGDSTMSMTDTDNDIQSTSSDRTQPSSEVPKPLRYTMIASLPIGPGSAPLPDSLSTPTIHDTARLSLTNIYILDSTLCSFMLPLYIPKEFQVLVIKRGGCTFDAKLGNIPSFAPTGTSLRFVIVVSFPDPSRDQEPDIKPDDFGRDQDGSADKRHHDDENELQDDNESKNHHNNESKSQDEDTSEANAIIRPLLNEPQLSPAGIPRRNPIPMLVVSGGETAWKVLLRAASGVGTVRIDRSGQDVVTVRRRKRGYTAGIGFRRRYWFESDGTRIENLLVH